MKAYKKEKASKNGSKKFSLMDNKQASEVRTINTNSEQYDMGKIKEYRSGSKGYPSEAFNK